MKNSKAIAKKITDEILASGSRRRINRIALKSGKWPDNEQDEGGYCRSALQFHIKLILDGIK